MGHFHKTINLPKSLKKHENEGRYAEGLSQASDIWDDIDKQPNLNGFSDEEKGDIILRLGALIGFYGHNNQIQNAQTKSKNLLTEARQRFIENGKIHKVAECENYLTLAHWRIGELNEAKVWIEEAFSHNLPNSHPTKLYTFIVQSLLNISIGNYQENFSLAEKVEKDFNLYGDAFLNGSFCTILGISFNELGNHQKSLHYLELARYYHQRSRHKFYLGTVENNLAQLYKLEERFQQAHLASDNATKIFKQIKDRTHEGFSLDTKAQIFIHEQKFDEALQVIEKALKILAKTENKGYFVETMLTKVKALVNLDEISAATMCLFEAVEIAKFYIGEETAHNLIKEFENTIITGKKTNTDYHLGKNYGINAQRKLNEIKDYNIALSFASEDRKFVNEFYKELVSNKLRVFYDQDREVKIEFLGENVSQKLEDIYGNRSDYVVIFFSKHYAEKKWTNYELQICVNKLIQNLNTFIFPARFDETPLPDTLKRLGYIDLRNETPKSFAQIIISKIIKK